MAIRKWSCAGSGSCARQAAELRAAALQLLVGKYPLVNSTLRADGLMRSTALETPPNYLAREGQLGFEREVALACYGAQPMGLLL